MERPLCDLTDKAMAALLARGCFDSVILYDGGMYVSCDDQLIYRWDNERDLWIDLAEPIRVPRTRVSQNPTSPGHPPCRNCGEVEDFYCCDAPDHRTESEVPDAEWFDDSDC